MRNQKKGFTLIELIITIAIITVLISVAVPSVSNFINSSRIHADLAMLNSINKMTYAYGAARQIINDDIFIDFNDDDSRLQQLVDTGYFGEVPKPKVADEEFNWSIEDQVWHYSKYAITNDNITEIVFDQNFNIEDYISNYPERWYATEDGLESNYGLLFIPNDRDEYTITTEAILDEGTRGGYGIFFETAVGDEGTDDTGYCLQFDRGLDGVAIRPRINGNELSPDVVVRNNLNELIPSDRSDEWWSEQHEVQMDVTRVNDNIKTITVSIDGVVVIEGHEFESDISPDMNNTGFRVWGDTTQYKSIKIE